MQALSFLKKDYQPLNRIEISESALLHNYHYLSHLSDLKVSPVFKSNAYGHGLQFVAKIFDKVGAQFFCVDSLYEAYELLKIGIKTHILIMGYTNPENFKVKKLPFSFAVYDKETLEALHKYQPHAGIHVFVDTGMNREGIRIDELEEFLECASQFKGIKIEGLMSHFGASGKYNDKLTQQQVENFGAAQKKLKKFGFNPQWIHHGNSSAILHSNKYKNKLGNIVRAGIDIYGIDPEGKDMKLQPALRVITTLNQVKSLKKGESVGYDFTYKAKKNLTIGILPYGYYDGLDKRLSNNGVVTIEGIACPIIGRISMNIATIDISNVPNPHVGQEVVVYSNKRADSNSVYNAAMNVGTIPYDLLVHLASSTKRIVVK
jgi:alanine racemase